jgi:hypothetical protein
MMVNIALTICPMKRALVLTNESARHPFRQILPREIFRVTPPQVKRELSYAGFFLASFAVCFVIIFGSII